MDTPVAWLVEDLTSGRRQVTEYEASAKAQLRRGATVTALVTGEVMKPGDGVFFSWDGPPSHGDPEPASRTLGVHGEFGTVIADRQTGEAIEFLTNNHESAKNYDGTRITRFDIAEFDEYWGKNGGDATDILAIGYWYLDHLGRERYEGAEDDCRSLVQSELS